MKRFLLSDLAWGSEHETPFHDLQNQIRESTKVTHRREDWELCIFTDASDVFWAGVVAQCPKEELDKDLAE